MSQPSPSICWDCANATNKYENCPWSSHLEPVEGWTAELRRKQTIEETYVVYDCPLFERDSYNFGLKRIKKKEEENASTETSVVEDTYRRFIDSRHTRR